jgi:hypothetical protein
MRGLIALTLMLLSYAVGAEEWVILRQPPEFGPEIFVDSSSIAVFDTGLRRATVKVDSLGRRRDFEKFAPKVISFWIMVKSYDCERRMTRLDSWDFHWIDGSVHSFDLPKNPKWDPAPENKLVDPTIDFVCGWKPK